MEKFEAKRDVLERYCQELPGARIFLENLFLSSEGMSLPDVYQNYQMDLRLYAPTNRTIRNNMDKMQQAFDDISGIPEYEVEFMKQVYG